MKKKPSVSLISVKNALNAAETGDFTAVTPETVNIQQLDKSRNVQIRFTHSKKCQNLYYTHNF